MFEVGIENVLQSWVLILLAFSLVLRSRTPSLHATSSPLIRIGESASIRKNHIRRDNGDPKSTLNFFGTLPFVSLAF